MDRQGTLLLALGLLIAAAVMVSVSGWVLLARDRRALRARSSIGDTHESHREVHGEH